MEHNAYIRPIRRQRSPTRHDVRRHRRAGPVHTVPAAQRRRQSRYASPHHRVGAVAPSLVRRRAVLVRRRPCRSGPGEVCVCAVECAMKESLGSTFMTGRSVRPPSRYLTPSASRGRISARWVSRRSDGGARTAVRNMIERYVVRAAVVGVQRPAPTGVVTFELWSWALPTRRRNGRPDTAPTFRS